MEDDWGSEMEAIESERLDADLEMMEFEEQARWDDEDA